MDTVAVGDVELALREWGEPECAPILCWHGAGDQSRQFEQAARVWADEDGLHVLAPDAPGHGRSKPLPDGDYRPSRLASLAAGLLDELRLEQTIWCGFSWGASIGCRFGATYPQRTRALVLLEGALVDFRDDRQLPAPPPADSSLEANLQRGLRAEPTAESYDALRGFPLLVVASSRRAWTERLGFDPVERFRAHVPQADVREVESLHGHDLLAHDARNLARLVGDWLADQALV
jgi:pimeloyl-ACP methyl ester carboxylesterase